MSQNSEKPPAPSVGSSGFWVLLAAVAVAAFFLIRMQSNRSGPTGPFVGTPLPPIQAAGWLNAAKPLTAGDLAGKVVLLDFWATWCGPCVRGIPEVVEYHKRFRDAGVVVVGLTSEEGEAAQVVKNFVETRNGMDWPIGYGARPTFQMVGIRAIPTYLLFDRAGTCVWGGHSMSGLGQATIEALAR